MIIQMIKFYQKQVSSLSRSHCRFYPTCSQYCILAIEKYGTLKGLTKSFVRVIKCNPFFKPKVDLP